MYILVVQYDVAWENPSANFSKIEQLIHGKNLQERFIVLPEMFATGYSMNVKQIAPMSNRIIDWMQNFSETNKCAIAGSVAIEENGKYYNRLYTFANGKCLVKYDKRHLFSNAEEDKVYSPGIKTKTFTYSDSKIKPAICYDLRFPVWLRNTEHYDLLYIAANWPAKRIAIWKLLLQARAIENQSFVIGVNRTGVDENHYTYSGASLVIDAKGQIILYCSQQECAQEVFLDKTDLDDFRTKFDTLKDADKFNFIK